MIRVSADTFRLAQTFTITPRLADGGKGSERR